MKIKIFSILALFVFFFIFLFCTSSFILHSQPKQGSSKGIAYIDCHNHLHGYFRSPRGQEEYDFAGAAKVALASMDQYNINTIIVMPPPFPLNHPNQYTYKELMTVVKKYPGRFAFMGGGGTLNVMIQQAIEAGKTTPAMRSTFEKKAREIVAKGAVGFGEFAAEHFGLGPKHRYETAPPNHPLFLLLADIAAEYNVPIDIHMEAVPEEMPLPAGLSSPPNPKTLRPNIAAFERLLGYNRKARILWSHVGWCNTGRRTASFCATMLRKHPNLYMSFKISPMDSRSECRPIEEGVGLKAEWLQVIKEFPDRFIIGTDQFYISPRSSQKRIGPPSAEPTNRFFSLLPPDLARTLGQENPQRIFNVQ